MDPKPPVKNIADLAIVDPIAALGFLLHIPVVPTVINAEATFSSFDTSQPPIEAVFDTTITQRTWVDNIAYSLLLPNVFAGNILKPLFDATLKQQPGVSAQIEVFSGPKYTINLNPTPLENLSNLFAMRWTNGWRIEKFQTVRSLLTLTQAPPSVSPNGPPYVVTLTFNCWQFLDHTLDELGEDEARRRLREMGFCVPDVPCVRGSEGT